MPNPLKSQKQNILFPPMGKICKGGILFHECKIYIIDLNKEPLKRNYSIAMTQLKVYFSQEMIDISNFPGVFLIENVFVI